MFPAWLYHPNRKKDKCNPSNYRGISLLSSLSKLFEKLLLLRLNNVSTSLNPLQGGFRRGFSCLHTAFIFQEAVAAIREQKKKAFVAFLDAHKAFDTVWHSGLMIKLHQWKIPMYIWHLLYTWYNCQSSSVLWNSSTSRQFSIKQGVRQGAILSPLLYSIYVDELLAKLTASGLGISISGVYCGAPMYADDLALISDSAAELKLMLNIVDSYSSYWRYSINAQKSAILVFGAKKSAPPS